jgi:isopentenyl-diphosphate delta-isomerase
MSGIQERKLNHLRISLEEDVQGDVPTGFNDVRLIHRPLPELDLKEVDPSIDFFGKRLSAPLIISAITGGTKEAKEINLKLAKIAEKKRIGLSVGSQRVAIDHPETMETFSIVRETAPNTLIIGNIGCPQLAKGWGVEEIKKSIDMLDADAMGLHMNPLQEAIQPGGDTDYRGILEKIQIITSSIEKPIIMKETGCGISYEDALALEKAGVRGLEIAGLGGTSWSAVEYHIAKEAGKKDQEYLGQALWNWGIPTAISVIETSMKTSLKIIASGGIRTGAEMAKSIVLGGNAVGIAKPFLEKAVEGEENLEEYVDFLIQELKVVMFLIGAQNVNELSKKPAVILGRTGEWLKLRGIDVSKYARRISNFYQS